MPDEPEYEVTVTSASPEDCYFLDLWPKLYEGSIARANDAIARLTTLATAMAGGSVLLLKEDVCYGWWRFGAAACFFLALATAVGGTIPMLGEVAHNPTVIRKALARVAAAKRVWVLMASALLVLGMLCAVLGFAVRLVVS